jgi:hypothetical protein
MTHTILSPPVSTGRGLYLRALDPEGPLPLNGPEAAEIDIALSAAGSEPAPAAGIALDDLVAQARDWAGQEAVRFRDQVIGAGDESTITRVLLNCAPLSLSAGAWLQWMSSSANGDTALALEVLSLYATDIGVGFPHTDRGSAYRALLARHRVTVETDGLRLTGSDRVESFSFRFPGLLLAMSRLPNSYFPEILGADLYLRGVGTLPPLAALPAEALGDTDRADLDLASGRSSGRSGLARSLAAARLLLDSEDETVSSRLHCGFRWAEHELRQWCARLLSETGLARHPDYEIWRLLFSRARQAAVYHAGYRLDGRPLAEWFADIDAGPGPFLDALARSRLVRPGRPDRSPLLKGLISANGPMFRVFTDEDIAVIAQWISRLPAATSDRQGLAEAQRTWFRKGEAPSATHPVQARAGEPAEPDSVRAAFHALLNRADSPALRAYAHNYASRWLTQCEYRLDGADRQLPHRWNTETGLRGWLEGEHDRHGDQFAEQDAAVITREDLIESTLQLAPLIMIDGGWLQGFTDYRLASSHAGQLLFRTYWDELGNGDRELNHPHIYRKLLRQMGHELPPTGAREFAHWPGFDDRSFALPVYWLSISRFPRSLQPEILGLNLAMELSGVGGSYRTARVGLRKYGFSTQFVDLHNTIDNVATGHSAWAADAIDSYLTELPGGHGQQELAWQRIRIGYRSLNPPDSLGSTVYTTIRLRLARMAGRRRQEETGIR